LRLAATELKRQLRRTGFQIEIAGRTFALVREVAHRKVAQRHFDVQLMGGWGLLQGKLVEMATGEGKTLTATLPACTAALAGVPVHVITVNDYLAKRDAEDMGPIYTFLGLSVGVVTQEMSPDQRRAAYACDITYCTNKDLAFDYLRDRVALAVGQCGARCAGKAARSRGGADRVCCAVCTSASSMRWTAYSSMKLYPSVLSASKSDEREGEMCNGRWRWRRNCKSGAIFASTRANVSSI
jgi:preprotein translocase subunit SecA